MSSAARIAALAVTILVSGCLGVPSAEPPLSDDTVTIGSTTVRTGARVRVDSTYAD